MDAQQVSDRPPNLRHYTKIQLAFRCRLGLSDGGQHRRDLGDERLHHGSTSDARRHSDNRQSRMSGGLGDCRGDCA